MAEKELHGGAIVALVMDLMFASRIRGVAPDADIARTPAALLEAVGPGTRLVLVDLQARDAQDALRGLAERNLKETRVVAWGPHVMEDALEAARQTGAEVMARGAFVKALGGLVAEAGKS